MRRCASHNRSSLYTIYSMAVVFLSETERERLNSFPSDILPDGLTRFFTLTAADRQQIPTKTGSANRQLNKGESLHSLRRFLFFANEGKIRQSRDEAQVNQVGCLNFVTNAVVLWTTVYLQAIIKQLKKEGYPIHDDDLRHLSPARYEHINPYGNYEFNVGVQFSREKLRPLRAG
jgi:Tn3 transposase DDE domain